MEKYWRCGQQEGCKFLGVGGPRASVKVILSVIMEEQYRLRQVKLRLYLSKVDAPKRQTLDIIHVIL